MISRYSLSFTKERIDKYLGFKSIITEYKARFNIAPAQESYVLVKNKEAQIWKCYWGLIPQTTRNPEINGTLFNVHKNGISSKSSFRIPIRESRCIILADSYYMISTQNEAFRITTEDQKMMPIAGVYEVWSQGGRQIKSFSMLIKESSSQLERIHPHMPVILNQEFIDKWVDPETPLHVILAMLDQSNEIPLNFYRITNRIIDVSYDSPDIHEKYTEGITLFDGL